jgi:P27 family predicted phage terminase small subunit
MPARRPTALKLLLGTARSDRTRNEPQYRGGIPKAPATLCPAARGYWRELARLLDASGVLTEADRQALALTCEALAEHQTARAVLAELGSTYECRTESGAVMYRVRPEAGLAADAWRRAMRGLCEFGLSPSSRGRIDVKQRP